MKSRRKCIVCWAQVCDAALSVKVIIDFDRTYSAPRQQPPYLHTFYVSRQMINTDSLSWNLCQRHICFQTARTYIRPCNSDLLSIMHCHSSIPSIFREQCQNIESYQGWQCFRTVPLSTLIWFIRFWSPTSHSLVKIFMVCPDCHFWINGFCIRRETLIG